MKILSNKVDYGAEILTNHEVINRMADGNAPRGWMDSECVDLCNALNSIKGIETSESCCGHNYETYKIFFLCFDLKALRFIQACIDSRYWKYGSEWSIRTYISDSGPELLNFILESKSSDLNEIMVQVKDMIDSFNYYLNHEGRFKFLGLDHENFIFEEVEEIPFEY